MLNATSISQTATGAAGDQPTVVAINSSASDDRSSSDDDNNDDANNKCRVSLVGNALEELAGYRT